MSNKQIVRVYWGGYFNSPITLDMVPSEVDTVILAFIGPLNNKVETTFLCSKYPAEQIKSWVKEIQNRGIKVLMSILDTPQTHWNVVNMDEFGQSVKQVAIDEWGCDGVDIDAESGMPSEDYIKCFIELIQTCRKNIGPDKILTYTCYVGTGPYDGHILSATHNMIDGVQLMAYFDDFDAMTALFNNYKTVVGENKIAIGVKAPTTPLEEVKRLCLWNPNKAGMMMWTLNRDCEEYTGMADFTWIFEIIDNLFPI